MNKKGFVLVETLVVVVFVLLIFTILYESSVPLLGRLKEISYYNDLDATYDLIYIRKMVLTDANRDNILKQNYAILECANTTIANYTECNNLYTALGITYSTDVNIKDEVIFLKKTGINSMKNDSLISEQVKDYVNYVKDDLPDNVIILQNDGYISYLNIS